MQTHSIDLQGVFTSESKLLPKHLPQRSGCCKLTVKMNI